MEPAPIAIMINTRASGAVNPKAGISGATIAEVVIIATVDAPIAVFNTAAIINGKNTPAPVPKREPLKVSARRADNRPLALNLFLFVKQTRQCF